DRSELSISAGRLADKEAENIAADWIDDEVTIGPIPVTVTVNAQVTVKEGETFNATIDVTNITNFNSGQFELSFDSRIVNVTGVAGGSINGTAIPESTWNLLDANTVGVLASMPMGEGVNGSGYIATISFEVVGMAGDRSELSISAGRLADKEAENIAADWINDEVIVVALIMDTGPGTYPSISGRHEGTIEVYEDVTVEKLYTYPCAGTGGHSESVKIWNNTTGWSADAVWSGYTGDCHNIVFNDSFTLHAGETYSYIIETGSYPQIIHKQNHTALDDRGIISCDKFVDANGRTYNDWIPAIKLW
ncbi:MAG: cohesin domain-containing protein, partial [Euryarchaeota archaeon]|nr:cohesin domain-containing protein [Euryarchaeota archaeon]